MNLIIIGAPASGKGTQAKLLKEKYALNYFSPGLAFREIVGQNNRLSAEIRKYIDEGLLVPEEITTKVVKKFLGSADKRKGIIFDGYPRTLEQVGILDQVLKIKIDKVFYIEVSEQEIKKRVLGRVECPKCRESYNVITKPPKKEGYCDICGSPLKRREDEEAEDLERRLKVFREKTMPVIKEFKKRGVLFAVNGEQSIEVIFQDILKRINENYD